MLSLPIYRAKKIDSDERIKGYYCEHKFFDFELKERVVYSCDIEDYEKVKSMGFIFLPCIKLGRSDYYEKINPSTLEVSFDGEKFYSVEAVKYLIKLAENTPASELYKLLESKSAGAQE